MPSLFFLLTEGLEGVMTMRESLIWVQMLTDLGVAVFLWFLSYDTLQQKTKLRQETASLAASYTREHDIISHKYSITVASMLDMCTS